MSTSLSVRLAPWIATIALFAVWELACRAFKIPPFFLPPPSLVAQSFVEFWPAILTGCCTTSPANCTLPLNGN